MDQMLSSEEHGTALKVLTADTYEGFISTNSEETFKCMKDKNEATTFLPLKLSSG